MHLKQIEIQGYKSFASKTVVEIDPGITAVVGPNGSGKSNITDGVRWVLGEHSGKAMRTRRLEEVIFAGSDQRPPAGMAEVRITLNNEDSWLPLDFTEVNVARRVHRNGDSEFFINNNRVRLRDIQELFLRGGLGPSSYAILGQGLVEEVLRLRPEERRALIEEVADVRRHRARIEEAQRKRGTAQENLGKVRLLLDEIEPRMRTLERQAKRALKHAEIQRALRRALADWYGREWRHADSKCARDRETFELRERQQSDAAQVVRDAEEAAAEAESQQRAARLEAERAAAEQRRRADHVRRLEQEQALAAERQRLLTDRAAELRRDLSALDRDGATASRDVPIELDPNLERSLREAEEALTAARDHLAQVDAEQEVVRGRLIEIDEDLARLRGAQAEDGARLTHIAAERERLRADTGEARRSPLQAALEEAEAVARGAEEASSAAAAAAKQARENREGLAQRYYAVSAYIRNLESARAARERRVQAARDRLEILRAMQAESEGMRQGLRALFGGRGVPRGDEPTGIPGVLGVLRHLMRVPRGLERAIEAALEDYVDAVVFDDAEQALQVIDALSREHAGRIVTLPLDTLRHRSPLALQRESGVIGTASALVQCDDRFRPLIDSVLGRTIVVEDISAARQILGRGLSSVVTREGHLLRPLGAIVGGEVARSSSFGRESELQSLPGEIADLERSLQQSAEYEERKGELADVERQLSAAEAETERIAEQRAAAIEDAAARRAEALRLRGEFENMEAEAARARARLATLEEEEARLRQEVAARDTEIDAIEGQRPSLAAIEELASRRRECAQIAGEAEARQSALAGRHETIGAALRARAAAQVRMREQRQARNARLQEVDHELAEIAEETVRRERDLVHLREEHAAALAASPDHDAVSRLADIESARRETVQAAQRGLLAADRALLNAKAALGESHAARERLREAMRTDGFDADGRGRILMLDTLPEGSPGRGDVGMGESAPVASAQMSAARSAARTVVEGSSDVSAPARAGEDQENGATVDGAPVERSLGSLPVPVADDPEMAGLSDDDLRDLVEENRARLRRLGSVNVDAAAEYKEISERHAYLAGQVTDLEAAERRMLEIETELTSLIRVSFRATFEKVDEQFRHYFKTMFRGGHAQLTIADGDWDQGGVELEAQPPGKRVEALSMLSGGERALTAIALLFAVLEVNPAPFCVLDEVDAALDEANVDRFVAALKELATRTQFVVITHNRRTIEQADAIYGITMGEDSVSRVLSVRLAELDLAE